MNSISEKSVVFANICALICGMWFGGALLIHVHLQFKTSVLYCFGGV